ncbi:flagellar biosynthesis protein FlhF [Tahibacter soli]|uniref:Flagellar biosynthesis protein FlhF n=1 Tax=Tahibacter soli TaxID=2983605 RepID=A0A9X3YLF3_9GAMM|nr:flagellar biosynthesis protein FlhF [Tahibacter soli]MDC8012878.1 flagellar biosynthesis protein FlhF [Tahibacter soli]
MKIKRFVAPDMRSALAQVRDEQGPDAVILSNRRVDGGIEVVAATDFDEALVRQASRAFAPPAAPPVERQAARPAERPSAPPATAPVQVPVAMPAATQAAAAGASASDAVIGELRRELVAMRAMFEREVARFSDERLRAAPGRAAALEDLDGCGCDAEVARGIVDKIPADADPRRARAFQLAILAKSLTTPVREPIADGGVIALVGPTGVGKTTTLAKLAARYAHTHGTRDVALVTTDAFRIGAREQLHTYGRLLGMPVAEASSEAEIAAALERLSDYRLVLVDTAGMSQRDRALAAQLSWLARDRRIRSYLVMPANAQPADLDDVVRRFAPASPAGVVLTKLDETSRLGAVLSVTIRHRLPIAYVTDGQRVPEDLYPAEPQRLALRVRELRRSALEETRHAAA